jgi:hypothetical protein
MAESNEKDLVIAALRQRMGELVSAYETDIAIIRANYTKLKEEFDHVSKVLSDQTLDTSETKNENSSLPRMTKFTPPEVKKKKD